MITFIVATVCLFLPVAVKVTAAAEANSRLPIVYVYTVVPAVCKHGLPEYIRTSLEQAIATQPDCDVMLASNFADCPDIEKTVEKISQLIKVDTTKVTSARTVLFANVSREMFMQDYGNELWLTSALRFLIMEDIMIKYNYHEMMHIEADNMLYGRYTSILPELRSGYKGIAATPLTSNKSFITASVFWISNLASLVKFNDYLINMGKNIDTTWMDYLKWLRKYACCKKGGYDPDENGNGIKPFAINEMSMLGNYHRLYPEEFKLLPVVPEYEHYPPPRHVCNLTSFAPGGTEVGPPTGRGIWDANSWGQFIGGTSRKKGRDKGFTDASHISGQAIRAATCRVHMICGNQTTVPYGNNKQTPPQTTETHTVSGGSIATSTSGGEGSGVAVNATQHTVSHALTGCYTAPFVQCNNGTHDSAYTPLWNLHVHSKHTVNYRSEACYC